MLQVLKRLAVPALIALLTSGALADENAAETGALTRWHQAIGSGYQDLSETAASLSTAAAVYCTSPSDNARVQVEQAWKSAFLAWQRMRFVDFGPVETDNRTWQFQFWPDAKNLVARKAKALTAPGSVIDDQRVRQAGVAVQGFPMVEFLLFDGEFNKSGRTPPSAESCQLLTAVTRHLAANSQALAEDWSALRSHYLANRLYADTTIKAAMAALEVLEQRRLAAPMGLRGNQRRSVFLADAWRSGSSLASVDATVRGLKEQFLPGLIMLLAENGQNQLATEITAQFDAVLANFPALDTPMAPLLASDRDFSRLQGLYVDLSQLVILVNDQAATTLGVVRGFNSSDGD